VLEPFSLLWFKKVFQAIHRLKGNKIWQNWNASSPNNQQALSTQFRGSYLTLKKNLYIRLLSNSQECLDFLNTC
jgi:hypothetical protein